MKKASAQIDFRKFSDSFQNLGKDIGTWPMPPKIMALLGIFAAVLFLGWFFFWGEQVDTLEERRTQEENLRKEYVDKKTQAVNLPLYRQQQADIDKAFGSMLKQLPSKAEVEALLIEINQSGMGRGLQFELFKPGQEIVHDFYAELPINVRLLGNYHDFGAFAGDIAKLSRIVTLNNISIGTGKSSTLTMDSVTRTYRYLDEEELAAKRKATQDAKKKGGRR